MTASPNPTTTEEIKKPETVIAQPQTQPEKKENDKTPETQETQEQINWKKFREVREKERKAKEEAERRAKEKEEETQALKAALEAVLNKPQANQTQELSDEDEIEKKIQEAIKKNDEQKDRQRRERERSEEPVKIRQTFPDFDKICSTDNVDYLEYHHPETFAALKSMPDSFEKWTKVYNAIKRYIPNTEAAKDAKRAEANLKKPQSMSSGLAQTGDQSPIMALTEERKRDNWVRMQRKIKGLE